MKCDIALSPCIRNAYSYYITHWKANVLIITIIAIIILNIKLNGSNIRGCKTKHIIRICTWCAVFISLLLFLLLSLLLLLLYYDDNILVIIIMIIIIIIIIVVVVVIVYSNSKSYVTIYSL